MMIFESCNYLLDLSKIGMLATLPDYFLSEK